MPVWQLGQEVGQRCRVSDRLRAELNFELSARSRRDEIKRLRAGAQSSRGTAYQINDKQSTSGSVRQPKVIRGERRAWRA